VTQTDNRSPDEHAPSPAARLAWILLILATLYFCYFHNLGAIGLVGPDEPRYAWIARDMAETREWVTPRLYGQPWFEKPVLYYWGAALCFKIFDVSEVSARLPSAVAALLATLAMAWLARRLYGAETALWLLLLLPTTVGMIGFSHAAAPDMPFAAMLTIAMVCAAAVVGLVPNEKNPLVPHTPWLALLLLGFSLGLAVLAKGPAAIILSGGAVLLWALVTKRWRDAFRCLHPIAIASFCLSALPWYVLCARRNPDFLRVFVIEHNFRRYLTPEFRHLQPFWFYMPILLVAFAPWTLLLLWSIMGGSLRSWRNRYVSASVIFLVSWPGFCLLFFSLSQSKLPGYALPAVPAIGLLYVRSFVALSGRNQFSFRRMISPYLVFGFPMGLILFLADSKLIAYPHASRGLAVVAFVLFLFIAGNLPLFLRHRPEERSFDLAALGVLPVILTLVLFPTLASPWLRPDPSGKTLAAELHAKQIPPDQIYAGNMRRGQQFSLSFYLHREVADWSAESPKEGYLLLNSRACSQYVKPPWACGGEPIQLPLSGWFLFAVRPALSANGLGGLGVLRGDYNLRNGADRQAR
jgi:4-amino-4-deoxy-L-arabinose transferase-like glycosyltransferase